MNVDIIVEHCTTDLTSCDSRINPGSCGLIQGKVAMWRLMVLSWNFRVSRAWEGILHRISHQCVVFSDRREFVLQQRTILITAKAGLSLSQGGEVAFQAQL